jgi:FlaA1/EpsC-like NDP-sugar epimerase
MIIGAGYTASAILEEISRGDSIYDPICMIDDDPDKIGRIINDIEVVDNTKNINVIVQKYAIDVIIFAIPSLGGEARQRILIDCNATKCQVKVLPYMSEMIENVNITKQMRDINIADLLGRQQITFDDVGVASYIYDKVVMVTGGGGSIGSELCRQIAKYKPRRIVIVDVYENCAYNIQQEMLRNYGKDYDLHVEIVSITDYDKMDELFTEFRPQIIFHAAAHKHVPLMETVPEEAVKNNIFGTYNVALLADKHKVQKFIMISTDKAVNPTNVMGATKRCCEEIVQMMAQKGSETEFAAVRFGNVLGSNGSVIPLFKEQIEKGGPVTVTHPDIIRYFMTIPEAVSLVLQAGTFAHGGEIFVLDMGKQVKIVSLAENLIKLMGYKPYTDIDIVFTGLRPGEKLYEELLMDEEGLKKTDNEKIFIGHQVQIDIPNFTAELEKMRKICFTNDKYAVIEQLKVLVPTFRHDAAYLEKITEQAKQYQAEVQSD